MSKAGNSITFASNAFTQLGNDSVIYVASNLDSLAGIYSRDMTALAVTNGGTFSDSATFTVGTLATPVKDNSVGTPRTARTATGATKLLPALN